MKIVFGLILVVLLVLGGAGAYLYFNSGALAKDAIEQIGTETLGSQVSVGAVNLSFADGAGELKNLRVANPAEFGGGDMIVIDTVGLTLDLENISETLVGLKRFAVNGAKLNVVAKGKDTNLQALMDHLEEGDEAGAGASGAAEDEVKLIIDRLEFTGAEANLTSDVAGALDLKVPDVKLNDVGRAEGGVTTDEVAQRVLQPITRSVTRDVLRKTLKVDEKTDELKSKLRSKLSEKLGGLKDKL